VIPDLGMMMAPPTPEAAKARPAIIPTALRVCLPAEEISSKPVTRINPFTPYLFNIFWIGPMEYSNFFTFSGKIKPP